MGIAGKHLSESQLATIARSLFTVKSEATAKGELHGLCPIHQEPENTPSPSFSYNYKKDSYHCFSCGADGDLLKLWTEIRGLSQKEGFKAFCDTYDIPYGKDAPDSGQRSQESRKDTRPDVELTVEQTLELMRQAWEKFPSIPSGSFWSERLRKERGWTEEVIRNLDIRLQTWRLDKKTGNLKAITKPGKLAIPIFDQYGALQNIRLYQPGAKQYKIISFAQATGESRLFPAKPPHEDQVILLCEGESDTICALSHGFNAITQTSKLKDWPGKHLAPFRDKDVVIAYDADNAGRVYADYAGECLKKASRSLRVITWPDFMGVGPDGSVPKDHGQDLTDFFVRHGKNAADLQALIDASASFEPLIPPPLPDDEPSGCEDVRQFWDYGITKRYGYKPRLLADRLLQDILLMFDPGPGILYKWNGRYWQEFAREYLENIANTHLGIEADETKVKNACFLARTQCPIPIDRKVNDRDNFICIQNGMLNIDTFELVPHDPDFYCTYEIPVTLDPNSTKRCTVFETFLDRSVQDPESIAQMQEFAGYIISRDTKYEKCLFLLGPGRDGKSKFIGAMKDMVGIENVSAVSFADLEKEFARSSLYNKMLNVSTEIGNQAIESPYFKAITSGDPIMAAFKHKDNFTFSPYCKLIFAGNQLPRIKDNSDALFERVLPIQFRRQFLEGDPDRDVHLADKLREERSEIFYWALCGLKRLRDQGRFSESEATRELMQEFRRSNNPILCFVEENCDLSEALEIEKEVLYGKYKSYASRNGYKEVNSNTFFRELYTAKGRLRTYQARRGKARPRIVEGIALKPGA